MAQKKKQIQHKIGFQLKAKQPPSNVCVEMGKSAGLGGDDGSLNEQARTGTCSMGGPYVVREMGQGEGSVPP